MESNKSKYSNTFYALFAVGVAGVVGGLYYVYSIFNQEEEPTEETATEIEEIKQELEVNDGKCTADQAIQIMALTNKMSDEIIKKKKPDLDERRRAAIDNPQEYEMLIGEMLEEKQNAMMQANEIVMRKFPNASMEEMGRLLSAIPQEELERKVIAAQMPTFTRPVPNKEQIKQIYLEYGRKIQERIKETQSAMNSKMDQTQQEYLMFKIMADKTLVDDLLYIKHGLNEIELKYLVYKHNLDQDYEIKFLNDKISKFNEMMG